MSVDESKLKPLDEVEMDAGQKKFLVSCNVKLAYKGNNGNFVIAKPG